MLELNIEYNQLIIEIVELKLFFTCSLSKLDAIIILLKM